MNKNPQTIKDDIGELIKQYSFEFSTPSNRKAISTIISDYLGVKVVDKTTEEMVDMCRINPMVVIDNDEYPLLHYVDNITIIQRKYKLLKLKSKI